LTPALRVEFSTSTWNAPTSNAAVTVTFKRANDAPHTGAYSSTLTFTLSTTNP
jgi:hypothetical protein